MSIIGDGIMLGAGGETASIFVTGLSETDNVSATHKVPVKIPNPEWKSLPDGYTQLEYIEGTGTQYLTVPTPTVSNGFDIEFSLYSAQQSSGFQPLFVSSIDYGLWIGWYNGSFIIRTFNHDNIITVSYPYDTFVNVRVVYDGSTVELYFDNVKVGSGSVSFADGAETMYIFYDGSTKISCKLGAFKFSVGNAVTYHYIPASNSSSIIGLYDLVNDIFYTNSGTGTFTAGAEIPQYIDGYVDGKTIIGKWTQIPNPAYVVLPDGYTQLEYIESTGTQYIQVPAPIVTNGFIVEFSFYSGSQPSGYYPLFVSLGSNGFWLGWLNGSFIVRMADNKDVITTSFTTNKWIDAKVVYDGSTVKLFFDGNQVGSATATFANGGVNTYFCYDTANKTSFRLGEFEFSVGGTVIYHYVPCKNGSNSVGLYDLVTETFYGNSGTGTFTAGAGVPQTIDGFLIDKIKDYGTWTVTATNGTKTATETVVVDSAVQYGIEMLYGLKIYWDGDAYQPVTAFDLYDARKGTPSVSTSFETDCVRVKQDQANTTSGICSANSIDLSQYSKLSIEWSKTSAVNTTYSKVRAELYGQNYSGINVGVNSSGTPLDNQIVNIGVSDDYYTDYTGTHHVTEFDLSGFDQTGYIAPCFWYTADAKIYKVWLE